MEVLAYLGPEGTFTHQAALDLAGDGDELLARDGLYAHLHAQQLGG